MSSALTAQQLVDALHWRYATKKFDPAKTIPPADWQALEQALVLSPSSIGLQPWKFIVVTDPATKSQLVPAAYHQTQAMDCSHFVVFTVRKDLGADHVEKHIDRMVEVLAVAPDTLGKFRQMTLGNLDKARAEGRLDTWQTHQIYIALGQFMASAAVLGIDTCPMEGIEPEKFDELLGLAGTDYATVVACAAGYRRADDKYAARKKVRFKADDVIVRI
ncbi:MAG: NAD(P)H-dependent oxidoreductase [Opitutus sp.]|nr:NAD(P)H-dependent oxidoreductase [Opitutus sp.]